MNIEEMQFIMQSVNMFTFFGNILLILEWIYTVQWCVCLQTSIYSWWLLNCFACVCVCVCVCMCECVCACTHVCACESVGGGLVRFFGFSLLLVFCCFCFHWCLLFLFLFVCSLFVLQTRPKYTISTTEKKSNIQGHFVPSHCLSG